MRVTEKVTEMTNPWPKYVRQTKGQKLRYQRDFPTELQPIAGKKTFTYPLNLQADKVTDASLALAVLEASEQYDLQKKMLTQSDPHAFTEAELDKAALGVLKKHRLRPSQFSRPVATDEQGTLLTEEELQSRKRNRQEYLNSFDLAEEALPDFEDIWFKEKMGEPLNFQEQAIRRAMLKLLDAQKAQPKTLSLLWGDYCEEKQIDINTREGKRLNKRWQRFLALMGDAVIAPNTLSRLHQGLDDYVAERKSEVKGQTIKRELNQIIACFRWASRKYRFNWMIEAPLITLDQATPRLVMNHTEQKKLVAYCLSQPADSDQLRSAAALCMLQGGMMPSELARLEPEDLHLDADFPYLLVRQKTKTESRKRLVPIVLASSFIAQCLPEMIERLKQLTDSARSQNIKVLLRRATENEKLTGHCLRHTFRANAEANGANSMSAASIGGWSAKLAGLSEAMLNYGNEGLTQSEALKQLHEQSRIIHRHLAEYFDGV